MMAERQAGLGLPRKDGAGVVVGTVVDDDDLVGLVLQRGADLVEQEIKVFGLVPGGNDNRDGRLGRCHGARRR